MSKKRKRKVESRMTETQGYEVENIVDEYLDEMDIARGKVIDRIAEIVRENPLAKDEILYTLARGGGSDLAIETAKGIRKRLDDAEKMDAKADLYRKYKGVIDDE